LQEEESPTHIIIVMQGGTHSFRQLPLAARSPTLRAKAPYHTAGVITHGLARVGPTMAWRGTGLFRGLPGTPIGAALQLASTPTLTITAARVIRIFMIPGRLRFRPDLNHFLGFPPRTKEANLFESG